jgi:hypothetical protein
MTPNRPFLIRHSLAALACALLSLGAGKGETVLLADTGNAKYLIQGSFEVKARLDQVWDVLTDYDGLNGIVSTLVHSQVVSRDGASVLVKQTARGRFLFFHREIPMLLRITEKPLGSLAFTEVSKTVFKDYDGSWTLQDLSGTVKVDYELQVSRACLAPAFIERGLFRDNALTLLQEMKKEITRRVQGMGEAYGGSAPIVTLATQVPEPQKSRD